MIGQAQFTYTDKDMIATQRAGWSWFARWRNLPIAYVGIVIFTGALFAGLDARFGGAGRPARPRRRHFRVGSGNHPSLRHDVLGRRQTRAGGVAKQEARDALER